MPRTAPTLVGLAEIAKMVDPNYNSSVAAMWAARFPSFPAPLATLACGRIWDRRVVRQWLIDTDRIESAITTERESIAALAPKIGGVPA
ncbi:MAG: hypothetical protein M3Q39_15935 [Actinomycetota bacterium]|nr:hypothetical protein [Actinomycetota bacterium]